MAANRFTGLPKQEYVSQFIPLDLDLIAKVGQYKQAQYDKGLQELEDTKGLFKVNSTPEESIYRDKLQKQYNDQVTNLANQYYETGDKSVLNKLRSLTRDFTNDPDRLTLEGNYKGYNDIYLKQIEKLGNKYRPVQGQGYDTWLQYTNDLRQGKGLKRQSFGNMYGYEDYQKQMAEQIKDIAADQTSWAGISDIDENGMFKDSKGQNKHITETRVGEEAAKQASSFLGTDAGRWYIDEKINTINPGAGHVEFNNLNPEMQKALFDQATIDIARIGHKQVFQQTIQDVNSKFAPYASDLRKEKKEAETNPVYLPLTNIAANNKYKAETNTNTSLKSNPSGSPYVGGVLSTTPVSLYPSTNKTVTLTEDQKKILDKAEKYYGEYPGIDNKETQVKLINKYLDNFYKTGIGISINQYTNPDIIKDKNKAFFSSDEKGGTGAVTRGFKTINGDDSTPEYKGAKFLEKYGDPDKYNISIIGKASPDNPYYSAGEIVNVTSKTGESIGTYLMEGDRKEQDTNKYLHNFYQVKYSPLGEKEINIPDATGKNHKFNISYEQITGNSLDENGRPNKLGEIARLKGTVNGKEINLESDGSITGDAIKDLYNLLNTQ